MKYRDWYNSEVANKLSEIKYNMECAYFAIDCDDPMDLDADVIAMPTPQEFISWINEKGKYFVSVSPETNYDFGYVFTYNVWELIYDDQPVLELSYDDHYDLKLHKTNFRTYQEAFEQAAYDLLMKITESNGKI